MSITIDIPDGWSLFGIFRAPTDDFQYEVNLMRGHREAIFSGDLGLIEGENWVRGANEDWQVAMREAIIRAQIANDQS